MDVTPYDIHHIDFKRAPLGKRGYDENAVDDFLDKVQATLTNLIEENSRLHDVARSDAIERLTKENTRLSTRIQELEEQNYGAVSREESALLQQQLAEASWELQRLREESQKDLLGISSRAVNLLSQAQLSADMTIEQAEQYARDLIESARQQHREILDDAHRSQPARLNGSAPTAGGTDVLPQVEHMRAYTQIVRVQLKAVVQALAQEIDRLGEFPEPGEAEVPGPNDWESRLKPFSPPISGADAN